VTDTAARSTYTRTAIILHWLMAVLIIGTLALGWTMADLPLTPSRVRLFNYHKWIGITIFLLAAARLLWRVIHHAPPLPVEIPRWQRVVAHAVHWSMYALFFLTPLAGWVYSSAAGYSVSYLGLVPLPDLVAPNEELAGILESRHALLAYSLAVVVTLHIVAAIKHGFDDPAGYLRRMTEFES
jgi:cytochrome b561